MELFSYFTECAIYKNLIKLLKFYNAIIEEYRKYYKFILSNQGKN